MVWVFSHLVHFIIISVRCNQLFSPFNHLVALRMFVCLVNFSFCNLKSSRYSTIQFLFYRASYSDEITASHIHTCIAYIVYFSVLYILSKYIYIYICILLPTQQSFLIAMRAIYCCYRLFIVCCKVFT